MDQVLMQSIHENSRKTRMEKELKQQLLKAQEKTMKTQFYLLLTIAFIILSMIGLIFLP